MINDNKLIFKNTVILYIRLIVTSIIGLFTSRYIFRALGASDYGLYNVVGGVVVMMAFLNTVMITTTYRYIAFEMGKGNHKSVNKVFNISMVIHIALAFFVLLLTETLGVWYVNHHLNIPLDKIPDALFVLRFSTYATIFSIVSIPFQGLVTAQENFTAQATIEIIRNLSNLLVAIVIVYHLGNDLRLYSALTVFVSIVPAVLYFTYCKHKYNEIVQWEFQRDKSKYKEMVGFSSWIMLGAAASVGQSTGANLIINSFFGTLLNAAFGIANSVNGIVSVFAKNLGQAAIPQITKSFSGGNIDRTINLAVYISKYSIFLMFIPALPILLETEYLLTIWLGDLPPYTVVFCRLMIINALVSGLGSGLPSLVQATGKIKYFQIILSITSLLSLPIAYFLFRAGFSPNSILITYVATSLVNVVVWQILLKRIINFNVRFFLKTAYLKIFYVSILITPLFLIIHIFPKGFLRFISISIFSIIWLLASIYMVGIESKERNMVWQVVKKAMTRLKKTKYE